LSSGSAPRAAPYGSWASPIRSELIARGTVNLGQLALRGEAVWLTEGRPAEQGRNVLVRIRGGHAEDVTTAEHNVRTRVHEYGGGDYTVGERVVYFANFSDQRVYRQDDGARAGPITAAGDLRYADFQLDERKGRLICVREDKRLISSSEDVNTIVSVSTGEPGGAVPTEDDGYGRVLVEGNEFYASPRLSPDGTVLAWLTWNRPDMPWDAAELWVGAMAPDGVVQTPRRVAGGSGESIFQPEWGPGGTLYFVSDRSGYWNLHQWREGELTSICPRSADFGVPQWLFGLSTYAVAAERSLVVSFKEHGAGHLAKLDTATGTLEVIATGYTWIAGLRADPTRAIFLAGSPTQPTSVVELDLVTHHTRVLRRSTALAFDTAYLSQPEALEFPTEGGAIAHAFFYPPRNADFVGPASERPPLIVKCHGGPTGASTTQFAAVIQHWTSRGIAVVDVNYGGSSGYGRAYRDRLKGQWGVVDVDDCVNAARFLVARGDVDGERLAITGGSAGGYTALAALTFRTAFRAGASHYGISDLEKLAEDASTDNQHKFESRYHESLVAPYPSGIELYRARSPIQHTDMLSSPIIFFQGLDDRVVLPNQSTRMVEVMRARGIPVAYVPFVGEGHGFRRAENIQRTLDAELYFYSRVFGFDTADAIEPVTIDNMPLPANAVRICFVCLGNICRSPSAESVLRHRLALAAEGPHAALAARVHVESAGTGDWHVGREADERARESGLRRGYALDRTAQQFTPEFFDRFDLVIAMDRSNRATLRDLAPDDRQRRKVHLLRDFDPGSPPGSDVIDPYYGGPEGFEQVLDMCEAACAGLLDRLFKGQLP
jgi:dipeptidyl aminopeptidase/acylaminoacyl peptidase/protein-tyrosine-phosphatase